MSNNSAKELRLRSEAAANLPYYLRGAATPSLRAVVIKADDLYVETRFVIDGPVSEALEELLTDLNTDTMAAIPAMFYEGMTIEFLPEPRVVSVSDKEQLVFHRWEPGQRQLSSATTTLGVSKYPPPSAAEISEVLQAIADGRLDRHDAAVWARYWTTSGDDPRRPEWYRTVQWSTLREIAADDPGQHRPAPIPVHDANLGVHGIWFAALTNSLLGAVPWTLRAVVLGVGSPRVWIRFIIDGTTSAALAELLGDVAADTVAGVPTSVDYTFDYAIESLPEPGIIHRSGNEITVYERCEPGRSRLLAPTAPLGVAKNPPPTREEIAEVLQQLADGAVPRYPASSWARYWTATIDKPHWYSSEHWSILEEIATCDSWVRPEPDAELIQRPDDHYRELLASL